MKVNIEIISDNKLEQKIVNIRRKNINRIYDDFKARHPKEAVNFSWNNSTGFIHDKKIKYVGCLKTSSELEYDFIKCFDNSFKMMEGKFKFKK
jgi:hypothetical protein